MYVTFQNKSLGNSSSSSEEGEQLHPVDLFLINDLWVPNVFIYNLKTFKVRQQMVPYGLWDGYTSTCYAAEAV